MAVALPNGEASLDIEGVLQDIVNNWNALLAALQAQGIDPTFLQQSTVTIHAGATNISASVFVSAETGINNWKNTASVKATTIVAKISLIIKA